MTLSDWLHYIRSIHQSSIDLGLDRVFTVAKKLNAIHFSCPVITVAGTNGKGSTVRALEVIYQQAGYRVAAYTSPHLIDFRERLRLNSAMLPEETWCDAFEKVEIARADTSLSFFEFTFLAALLICQAENRDVLLLEVGLGGRLDAVNVVENDLAILTSVDLDHADWLGDTREKIAAEKAAIVRKHLICGEPNPPDVVSAICKQNNAVCDQINASFRYVEHEDSWSYYGKKLAYPQLQKPSLLVCNVANAIMAVEQLQHKLPVGSVAIESAMEKMCLPGRFEVLPGAPRVILDVAHNPHAARKLADQLFSLGSRGVVRSVFSALCDKSIEELVAIINRSVDCWYIAGLTTELRGLSSEAILAKVATQGIKDCYTFKTVSQALKQAMEDSVPDDTIVVWGSFHTVGQAKQWLQEERNERTI